MQPRAVEARECPGLEHPGQNKTERPKEKDGGRSADAPDCSIRGGTSSRAAACQTGTSGDKWRPDAPGGRIRDGTHSRGCRRPDWIIRGLAAARRHGLDHPGRIKQQEPPQPGLDDPGTRGGQAPRTATSGVDQAAGATAPRSRESRVRWRADAPDRNSRGRTRRSDHNPQGRIARGGTTRSGPQPQGRSVQGKVAARGEGNGRPRAKWCSEGVKSGGNAKDTAGEKK